MLLGLRLRKNRGSEKSKRTQNLYSVGMPWLRHLKLRNSLMVAQRHWPNLDRGTL